jgi:hypothetical protein
MTMAKRKRRRVNLGFPKGKHEVYAERARRHARSAAKDAIHGAENGRCSAAFVHYEDALTALGRVQAHVESAEGRADEKSMREIDEARRALERRCGLPKE